MAPAAGPGPALVTPPGATGPQAPTPGTGPASQGETKDWGSTFGQVASLRSGPVEEGRSRRILKLLVPLAVIVALVAVAVFVLDVPGKLFGGDSGQAETQIEGTEFAVTPPEGWEPASEEDSKTIRASVEKSGLPIQGSAEFVNGTTVLTVSVLAMPEMTSEVLPTLNAENVPAIQIPPFQVTRQEFRAHALGPAVYVEASKDAGQAMIEYIYMPGRVILVALINVDEALHLPDDLTGFGAALDSIRDVNAATTTAPAAPAPSQP